MNSQCEICNETGEIVSTSDSESDSESEQESEQDSEQDSEQGSEQDSEQDSEQESKQDGHGRKTNHVLGTSSHSALNSTSSHSALNTNANQLPRSGTIDINCVVRRDLKQSEADLLIAFFLSRAFQPSPFPLFQGPLASIHKDARDAMSAKEAANCADDVAQQVCDALGVGDFAGHTIVGIGAPGMEAPRGRDALECIVECDATGTMRTFHVHDAFPCNAVHVEPDKNESDENESDQIEPDAFFADGNAEFDAVW
jgi:hypothetical protein